MVHDPLDPSAWPSLRPQRALAARLGRGDALAVWLGRQLERVGDPAFAALFADHLNLPGIARPDYAHRLVGAGGGTLLGGIRFYGRDVARPFVEVVAHDLDLPALLEVVRGEWAAFRPLHARLIVAPGLAPAASHVDMSVHAARHRDIVAPDGRVRLAPFADAGEAVAMVAARFAALAREEPALARNIEAAEPEELREWHLEGTLRAIVPCDVAGSGPVGLLAVRPGAVEWIAGDEVHEEVVARDRAGRGYAAAAQAAWAARSDIDRDRLMVGTIDALNVASRRSAERVGRARWLDYVLMPLRA